VPWWQCICCRHVSNGLFLLLLLLLLFLLIVLILFLHLFFLFFLLIEHGDTRCLYTPFVLPRLECHTSRRTLFV
jgi:hypothetical protein